MRDVEAKYLEPAAGRWEQAEDGLQERAFSSAIRSEQSNGAGRNRQRDVIEGTVDAVPHGDMVQRHHTFGAVHSCR
jgi:hypothetical protein